jgi:hypothetical protein
VRPAAPSGSVLVRIMPNDQRVWLESRPRHDGSAAWQPVCQAPCDRRVEVEDRSLRIAGQGLRPSNPFHVKGDGDILKLSVRPGSERTHLWGRGLFVSGITLGIASGAVYGLGRVQDSDAAVVGGIIGMAVGGVALLGSLPLLFSGRTTVRNRDGVRVGQASEGATAWPVF